MTATDLRAQPAIEDLALLSDTRSAALVSSAGSLEWLCLPTFDAEPVFGGLVDADNGGRFDLTVVDGRLLQRRYRDDSMILETIWTTPGGRARLTEGLVSEIAGRLLPDNLLVRRLDALEGPCVVRVLFDPMRGIPGTPPVRAHRVGDGLVCAWGSVALSISSSPGVAPSPGRMSEVTVEPGRPLTLVLSHMHRAPQILVDPQNAWEALQLTDRLWREWTGEVAYDGPGRDAVVRSLIVLRALTFSPSGSPVAAPTTSLPEVLGGSRNWDYRYSWPRDTAIGINAFLAMGKTDEPRSFMRWLLHATRLSRPGIDVLYTVYGKPGPPESEAPDVSGYRGSPPVRIGNEAADQFQLDVYGWILDAAWLMTREGPPHDRATWRALSAFADHLSRRWREPDAGIWERRGEPEHHVHSKLMAWLGLDRAIRMADTYRTRPARRDRWRAERDSLAAEIRSRGVDDRREVFVRAYGSTELDAALLLLPVLEFEDSERVKKTVHAIRTELGADEALVYRYAPGSDGLPGHEGVFLPTSFWLVQALARIGEVDDATAAFERLCSWASPLGLFAEEMDPGTHAFLGNMPQAFTHAALIQAALAIRDANSAR